MLYTYSYIIQKQHSILLTNDNKHLMMSIFQLHSIQLQQEIKSNSKKPSCKKEGGFL